MNKTKHKRPPLNTRVYGKNVKEGAWFICELSKPYIGRGLIWCDEDGEEMSAPKFWKKIPKKKSKMGIVFRDMARNKTR